MARAAHDAHFHFRQRELGRVAGDDDVGEIGSVTTNRTIELVGVSLTGSVGLLSVAPRVVALTGVSATGQIGTVIAVYWKIIDDSQTANWQNISNPQTPVWSNVVDTQTPNWQEVVT